MQSVAGVTLALCRRLTVTAEPTDGVCGTVASGPPESKAGGAETEGDLVIGVRREGARGECEKAGENSPRLPFSFFMSAATYLAQLMGLGNEFVRDGTIGGGLEPSALQTRCTDM
jgi:hypothetical protein